MTDEAQTTNAIIVKLGNTAPTETFYKKDDKGEEKLIKRPVEGLEKSVTTFKLPGNTKLVEAVATVTSAYSSHHSNEKAVWVESEHSGIAEAVADHFEAQVGRHEDWDSPEDEF